MNSAKTDNYISYYCGNGMKELKRICNPIIIKIGGISDLDYDDFYSIANRTVWETTKIFDESQHDNFEVFLRGCLERKFKTEMTRRNRNRRIPSTSIDRLDAPIGDESGHTLGDLIDSGFEIDNQIDILLEDDNLVDYINSLTPKQKKIAQLVIEGYELCEIKRILNMSDDKFNSCINRMKTFDKRILLKKSNRY